jgi:hypothetical protein
MPFKSEAQRQWMHATHPEMAKRWEAETPEGELPERVGPKRADKSSDGVHPDLRKALDSISNYK